MGAIRQLATDYWQLATASQRAFKARTLSAVDESTTTSSSQSGDTAPGLLSARAQVTFACDIPPRSAFPPLWESSFRPKMGIKCACRGRNFLTRMATSCYGLSESSD